jgi:hypothetical protein
MENEKKIEIKVAGIGNSVAGVLLSIALIALLFEGEPSIAESLRRAAQKWATTGAQNGK